MLPRLEELYFDCLILDNASFGDLLPCTSVTTRGFTELVISSDGCALQDGGRVSCRPTERMRQRLVLLSGRCNGVWGRDICAFQVSSRKVGNALSDGRA